MLPCVGKIPFFILSNVLKWVRKTSRWTVEKISISLGNVADVIIVLFVTDSNAPGAPAVLSMIFVCGAYSYC